jgi:hypothetical protein
VCVGVGRVVCFAGVNYWGDFQEEETGDRLCCVISNYFGNPASSVIGILFDIPDFITLVMLISVLLLFLR